MTGIRRLRSTLVPMPVENIDTDQIIPARFLKVTDKEGMADGLFANWRYRDGHSGAPNPDFVLNRPERRSASILIAGDNFGCGSSREHAAWALLSYGFQAVISTRFADIFRSNALKNGLLVAAIEPGTWRRLLQESEADPATEVTIDLETQRLHLEAVAGSGGRAGLDVAFEIDPFSRHCLLHGVDQFGYLLDRLPSIATWEADHPARVDTRQLG
jgi:3-isopropylmalate/(R)-2-methylmalate dehydratase small subunit